MVGESVRTRTRIQENNFRDEKLKLKSTNQTIFLARKNHALCYFFHQNDCEVESDALLSYRNLFPSFLSLTNLN